MKMTQKQILEQMQQVVGDRNWQRIGDAFLFPKIPTNTVSTGQAAAPVQYPKATEIAEYEAKIQAEIAAVVEAKKQMVAARVESDQYEYHAIQHINGDIETVRTVKLTPEESAEIRGIETTEGPFDNVCRPSREQREQRQREAEEQRAREQYQTDDRWGQF